MGLYQAIILKGWWVVLLLLAIGAVWLGRYVPELEVHTATSVFLGETDPDLAYYESTRPLWGYDEYAIVCATRDDWVDPEGAQLLEGLARDLGAIPHVASVISILDVPLLRQTPGPGFDLASVKTIRDAGIDFSRARDELVNHTQAQGNLISEDGRSVSLLVYLDMPEERRRLDPILSALRGRGPDDPEAVRERERLRPEVEAADEELNRRRAIMTAGVREVARVWGPRLGEPVRLSGIPIITVNMREHLEHDLRTFSIVALVFFSIAFLAIYRRPRFVLLPMIACILPVLLVVGAMSRLGVRVTLITANLPLLMFTLMLPYAVYLVERYRERRARFPDEANASSAIESARQIWTPCLFSCATTMAGFAALLLSDTRPVHDLGFYMVIGMASGLIILFLAIPSMSRPLPPLHVDSKAHSGPNGLVRFFERLTLRAPGKVVIGSLLLLGISISGATHISAQSKFTEYFRKSSEVYQGLEYIDNRMGGTTPLEVIVTSTEPGYFLKPDGLAALEAVARYFEDVPETGNVRSLATVVDELKKKNEKIVPMLPFLARLPQVRETTREFANDDYSVSRVLVRLRETAPTLDRNVVLDGLRTHLAAQPELEGLEVRETGVFLLYANMLNSLIDLQQSTFLYVVLAILLMLLLLFRSLPLAFLVLLPQLLPALVTLGAMGWFGIPLDLVTVVIASIAMGVGIDAAIQYTVRYRAELAVDGDRRAAISRAHATIGRAIWIATSVIVAGFCTLVLSDFRPSIWFGLFTAVAMLISQVAALTTLPSIFLLTGYPRADGGGVRNFLPPPVTESPGVEESS